MSYSALLWFNFKQTQELNVKTGSFDQTLLFGKLKFQATESSLVFNGQKEIARTRLQIAETNGKGLTATDEDLSDLIAKGLVSKRPGMWKGKRCLKIACIGDYDMGLNASKQKLIDKYTGDSKKSALLAFIAFWLGKNPYDYNGKTWAIISKREIKRLLCVCSSTLKTYVNELARAGIIMYEGRNLWSCSQYQIRINPDFYEKIKAEWEELERVQLLNKVEKSGVSIRINNDDKGYCINNNTISRSRIGDAQLVDENGTIILSKKEQNYLSEAVKRTLARCTFLTWGYETLMGHMRYVLTTPKNRNSAPNFVHCINRTMSLVRQGKWNEPFGYGKYSFSGVSERERLDSLANEYLCAEAKRRREESEQRVKHLEERKMYEKDEDEGNVGFQFRMAKEVFKGEQPSSCVQSMHSFPAKGPAPVLNQVQRRVAAGASEFTSHEDVMAKLLGKL